MATATHPNATVFQYVKPELTRNKGAQLLCRSERLLGVVQIVREGGETNLHSHEFLDGFWFVLRGRARFYTTDDVVVADLGPHEGILVPHDYPYWFESVGDDELEILQVEASAKPVAELEGFAEGRTNYRPRDASASEMEAELVGTNSTPPST